VRLQEPEVGFGLPLRECEPMKQTKIPLPTAHLIEIPIEICGSESWNVHGAVNKAEIVNARVKVVVTVPESRAKEVDPKAIREQVMAMGAAHCRTPEVRVIRAAETKRSEEHAPELDLETSIKLFAEEVNTSDRERKVSFAVELAREADAI